MRVRQAEHSDLEAIVDLHLASFPGFFLTFLGRPFLRILYRQMMDHPVGVILVCEDAGRMVGFAGGVTRQAGFYGDLVRHHLWQFAWASLGAVVRRPAIAPRLVRALRRPAESGEGAAEACLMSLGVDPAVQGRGAGRALVQEFCKVLCGRGCSAVCLTTDRIDNDRVNRFYQGLGFRLARHYTTPEGRQMAEYVRSLV